MNAACGVMTLLSAAQETTLKAHADAGSLAAIVNASSAAPETEVRILSLVGCDGVS